MAAPIGSIYALRELQFGKEDPAARGTPVPATEMIHGTAEITAQYPLSRGDEPLGVLARNRGPTPVLTKSVDIALRMPRVSYEQITWPLAACLDHPETTNGNGPPYIQTYDPGVAALWTPDSLTIEAKYTDLTVPEEVEVEYCLARSLTLSGEMGGLLNLEADIFGRQITDEAQTALVAPSTLQPISIATGKVYINDNWAAADAQVPATGQFTNQMISFNLEIDPGLSPFQGIDGNLYWTEHKERDKDLRFTMRCLYDTSAADSPLAERAKAQAYTDRFVTLAFDGTGNMLFYIAFACRHEMGDFITIGEQDGLDVVEMSFIGHYDPTGAKLIKAVVVNDDEFVLGGVA